MSSVIFVKRQKNSRLGSIFFPTSLSCCPLLRCSPRRHELRSFNLPFAASLKRCVMAPLPTKPLALREPKCVRSAPRSSRALLCEKNPAPLNWKAGKVNSRVRRPLWCGRYYPLCDSSRLTKRVCSPSQASRMVPVLPLRCLATMASATLSASSL